MKRPSEAPEPSASVYVQPAPHGPWSGNNNFGFETRFLPGPGSRERIINLPEWGEPAVWTVSLGIDYSETAWEVGESPEVRGFEIVAEVAYGTGGATETVEVDWLQGATFSVPMNALSINAFYGLVSTSPSSVQPDDIVLRVLISRGGVSTGLPPTKHAPLLDGTVFINLLDNTLIKPLARIPKFGRKLFIVPLTPVDASRVSNGNTFVRFFGSFDALFGAVATGSYKVDSQSLLSGFPVPAFSKYVALENVGGGAAGAVALFNFELQL